MMNVCNNCIMDPPGGGVLTLTWYTYMCLPFRVFFCENRYIDGWVQVALKGAQDAKIGCIWGKFMQKAPNFSKIGCFFKEIGILMGGEIGPKVGILKGFIMKSGRHIPV